MNKTLNYLRNTIQNNRFLQKRKNKNLENNKKNHHKKKVGRREYNRKSLS